MGIINLISRNFGRKSRTRLPSNVVPYPQNYRGTLQYDVNLCTGCQTCGYVCSPSAITFETSDPASIEWKYFAERCAFCGRCVQFCPTQAITFNAEMHIVTGDRSLHYLSGKVYYQSCNRCGRPIIPLPTASLMRLYKDRLPEQIAILNGLCEKCRSWTASEHIKYGETGKNTAVGK